MAKPDWGELQQRFLSEHAATGVSPKEWCEAQGLNYATARRYIKKTSAQTAQKSAQKKVRIAQKEQSANELMDDDGLTAQQRLFVAEYLKDGNATQAAIRAGYSKKSAEQIGYQLLQKTSVAQAIAQQQKASIARTLGGADEVLAQMWQLATFDANQLPGSVPVRRGWVVAASVRGCGSTLKSTRVISRRRTRRSVTSSTRRLRKWPLTGG